MNTCLLATDSRDCRLAQPSSLFRPHYNPHQPTRLFPLYPYIVNPIFHSKEFFTELNEVIIWFSKTYQLLTEQIEIFTEFLLWRNYATCSHIVS